MWRGDLAYAVTQCGFLDSASLACGVCWRPDVCVVAEELADCGCSAGSAHQCREGNKGLHQFVTSMAMILLKMKYDHGRVFVFCASKDS